MRSLLCAGVMVWLIPAATVQAADPPKEIQDRVKVFEESVEKSKAYSEEVKKAVKGGAAFYGKPYFLGGSQGPVFGGAGSYFTFWLFSPNEKPTYRAYSLDPLTGQTLLKVVLFAFEHRALWVAVYTKAGDPDRPVYVTVYPPGWTRTSNGE